MDSSRTGLFTGSRGNKAPTARIVQAFDGNYDVKFIRNGLEKAQAMVEIQDGVFSFSTTNVDGVSFDAWGLVFTDGTVVLNSATSDLKDATVLAQAFIDQENFSISGI